MAQIIDLCAEEANGDEGRRDMEVTPTFCLQSLAMQNAPVHPTEVSGHIDGLQHQGAHTNGNGACCFHAIFGECVNGTLYADDIRGRVHAALPDDVTQMLTQIGGVNRSVAEEFLICISDDIMLAAKELAAGEASSLFEALPAQVHADVRELARETRAQEQHHKDLRERLKVLLSQIFKPQYEETVVRMLCIQLNYLEPTAPDSLLQLSPNSQTLREYEGDRGGLDLLHACAERRSLTKYQALFDEASIFDRYREAVFLTESSTPGDCAWILGGFGCNQKRTLRPC